MTRSRAADMPPNPADKVWNVPRLRVMQECGRDMVDFFRHSRRTDARASEWNTRRHAVAAVSWRDWP